MRITKELIPGIIVAIVVIVGGSIYFNYDMHRKDKIIEELNSEYPSIERDDRIDGVVTHIRSTDTEMFRNDSSSARVTLDGAEKRRIMTSYEGVMLQKILTVGDRLSKEPGTDTLLICKIQNGDTVKFSFVLLNDLRYPLKSKANQKQER